MAISKVYMICNAYESGVGHGVNDDKLPNPFSKDKEPDLYEAYDIGYRHGLEMREENKTQEKGNV